MNGKMCNYFNYTCFARIGQANEISVALKGRSDKLGGLVKKQQLYVLLIFWECCIAILHNCCEVPEIMTHECT